MNPSVCERCGERPSTVHMTQVINGKKTEQHLCDQCAASLGTIPGIGGAWHVGQLWGALLPPTAPEQVQSPSTPVERCPHCGWTAAQFQESGRFGCDRCYEAFQPGLDHLVRRIQGSGEHHGKIPMRTGDGLRRQQTLNDLREQLKQAIQAEAFEEAARLRDEIRSLEQEVNH